MPQKVAYYDGNRGLKLESAPLPDLATDGAVVRIRACGIATSDIRAYRARAVPKLFTKLAGEIVRLAPEITAFRLGDRVYVNDSFQCGECSSCRRGFTNICENPTDLCEERVALSEFMTLPPKFLKMQGATMVGEDISFEKATYVGPLSNCLNTLRAVEFSRGECAVVLGAGPMGLLHVMLLRASGASTIVVLDVDEFRMQESRELGADYTVEARSDHALEDVLRLTDGGADIVIVATANPKAMHDAVRMARKRGRIDFFGGMALEPTQPSFTLDPSAVHYRELKIIGTYGSLPQDYSEAAELITSGRISPSRLDTQHIDFIHFQDILEAAEDPRALRVMVAL